MKRGALECFSLAETAEKCCISGSKWCAILAAECERYVIA